MKILAKLSCALLVCGITAIAHADPITGTVTIAGNDTYDASQITFNPTTAAIVQASGTMSPFGPTVSGGQMVGYVASLTGFSFDAATGVTLFTVTNSSGTLSFTISDLTEHTIHADGSLTLQGTGYLNETGLTQTDGTFSLTSSTTPSGSTTITGFQLTSGDVAPTPEPGSLFLLGTGLVGTAGTLIRRRRANVIA